MFVIVFFKFLIRSSAISPFFNLIAVLLCIHTPADAARIGLIFLSPTKLDIKPAKTSPVPITASSFEDLLLRITFFLICN